MEIIYKNKIVAFIDVLGFSALVYSETKDSISGYFEYVLDEFSKDLKKYNFEYYLISDSVVIHTEASKKNFTALVQAIAKLQMKLITRSIIVRGGISIGDLYVNKENNIIVGPGLISAYNLESKAIYPRVVIDRKIIPLLFSGSGDMIKKCQNLIVFDPPKPYIQDLPYIDYTYKLALVMQAPKLDVVKHLLRDNYYRNQNIEKYIWLKTHIIRAFQKQKDYLITKVNKNDRDNVRLRHINDFFEYLNTL